MGSREIILTSCFLWMMIHAIDFFFYRLRESWDVMRNKMYNKGLAKNLRELDEYRAEVYKAYRKENSFFKAKKKTKHHLAELFLASTLERELRQNEIYEKILDLRKNS